MYTPNQYQQLLQRFAPVTKQDLQGRMDTLKEFGMDDGFLGDMTKAQMGLIGMRDQARTDLRQGFSDSLSGVLSKFRSPSSAAAMPPDSDSLTGALAKSDSMTGEGLGLKGKIRSL